MSALIFLLVKLHLPSYCKIIAYDTETGLIYSGTRTYMYIISCPTHVHKYRLCLYVWMMCHVSVV